MTRALFLTLIITILPLAAETRRYAFFITGDPQYLAEKAPQPTKLDPYSEEANSRFVTILNELPGQPIPESLGGGHIAKTILGVIVTRAPGQRADRQRQQQNEMIPAAWTSNKI